jgi:hypothetical protein
MLRLLFNLFVGNWCQHNWSEPYREEWVQANFSNDYTGYYRLHQRCKKCGDVRVKGMR